MRRDNLQPEERRDDGFTLIEVLVALTILSLSLTVLLGTFSQSLSRTHESERAAAARVLAQSLLAKAETGVPPKQSHADGETDNGLAWSVDMAPYQQHDDDKASLRAANLSVTVTWENGQHALTLSTLRLVPKEAAR